MVTKIDLSSAQSKNKHFFCIDLTKFIFAILVVSIHVEPLKGISEFWNDELVHCIARVSVPFYFVASGYFLFRKISIENFDKSIVLSYTKRIAKLYLLWVGIYSPLIIYGLVLRDQKGIVRGGALRSVFVVGYGHLWYLHATVVAILFILLLLRFKFSIKYILLLGFCFYLFGLLAQSWFGLITPLQNIPFIWDSLKIVKYIIGTTRNGIFEGIFFISIGMLFAHKKIIMRFSYAVIGFFVSMLLLSAESYGVKYFSFCRARDMYFFLYRWYIFCFISSLISN